MSQSSYVEYATHLQDLDPDTFIGIVCWYCVSTEVSVPRVEFQAALETNGLERFLPNQPCAADVFRRVASNAQQRRVTTPVHGVFHNFLIRSPGSEGDKIIRRVVQEEVDANNLRLGYAETAELVFDRNSETVEFSLIGGGSATESICEQIVSDYEIERNHLNHNSIRETIKRILRSIHATNIRYPSGGVYFVPSEHSETILSLERVLDNFSDGINMHSLPLLDDRRQRDLLKKAFEAESTDKMKSLINEISELRRSGGGVTQKKHESYLRELLELKEKMKQYSGIVKSELGFGESAYQILAELVLSLGNDIRVDKRTLKRGS